MISRKWNDHLMRLHLGMHKLLNSNENDFLRYICKDTEESKKLRENELALIILRITV